VNWGFGLDFAAAKRRAGTVWLYQNCARLQLCKTEWFHWPGTVTKLPFIYAVSEHSHFYNS